MAKTITLTLTTTEASTLSEAVRVLQEINFENDERLNPVLSRIQRKLGEEPHYE